MQNKRVVFQLAMTEAECHLGNTLLNGQCFNWWKRDTDDYAGIYSKYFIQMQRLSKDSINVTVEPSPENLQSFKKQFLNEYLQTEL